MRTLKYAWRFLMRSKSYTIINLLGLAFSSGMQHIAVDPEHYYSVTDNGKEIFIRELCTRLDGNGFCFISLTIK